MIEKHFAQFTYVEDEEEINARIEKEAMKKYEKIKEDQNKRLNAIQAEIENLMKKAVLIETNQTEVQAIIDVTLRDFEWYERYRHDKHHQHID